MGVESGVTGGGGDASSSQKVRRERTTLDLWLIHQSTCWELEVAHLFSLMLIGGHNNIDRGT